MSDLLRTLRWCLPVMIVLAVVGGCQLSTDRQPEGRSTAADSSPGSASAKSSGGSSSAAPQARHGSPAPVKRPPAPKSMGCYRLTLKQLTQPTNSSSPVSCHGQHDAQTIYVGKLHTVVDGHSVAVDSQVVQHQLETTCPRKLAQFVGGSLVDRHISRFNVVWFSPTLAQSDRGANWFRCDVVAFAKQDTLLGLPSTGRLHHALNTSSGLANYGLCGTAAPGNRNFQRVICARRHSWKAVATIHINGGRSYPGPKTVRNAGDDSCKTRVQQLTGNSLKFSFGWEWPSNAQWKRGQHYGYCWAPSGG
jgi:hypothetical protein